MAIGYSQPNDISSATLIVYYLLSNYRMLKVPHQNGFHPASCSSPLPSSHTLSPGLSNGSPGSKPAKSKNKSKIQLFLDSAVFEPGDPFDRPGDGV